MDDIRIFIYREPKNGLPKALARRLFGIQVRVRGYLLIATKEPKHSEDALVYLVHNDDLRLALVERYGLAIAKRFYRRQSLPVGHVTKIPVDCCEVRTHPPTTTEGEETA